MLNMTEPFVQAYHDYQVDLAEQFGANRTLAEVEMMEALNFEIALANVRFYTRREMLSFKLIQKCFVRFH